MELVSKITAQKPIKWRSLKWLQNSNLKDIPTDALGKLKKSLIENNFIQPFNVWEDSKGTIWILDGHHREKALKELEAEGYQIPEELPANFVHCENKKDAAKLVLVYSSIYAKVSDNGLFDFLNDFDLKIDELAFVDLPNIDLDAWDLKHNPKADENTLDEVPETLNETYSETGDIFLLDGKHRVMCGDSTNSADIFLLMDGKRADMVFTDPPYGISVVSKKSSKVGGGGPTKFGKVGGGKIVESNTYMEIIGDNSSDTAKKFYETILTLGFKNIVLWGGNYFTDFLPPSRCWVVWDKEMTGNFSEAEMAYTSFTKGGVKIFKFLWNGLSREGSRTEELSKRVHPTQKPVGLFKNIFERFSDFKVIFDGFLGSGSTLIASEQTNRICYGMEIEPKYIDVILRRYKKTYPSAKIECLTRSFPFEDLFSEQP